MVSAGIMVVGELASAAGQMDAAKSAEHAAMRGQRVLNPYIESGNTALDALNSLQADPWSITDMPGYQFNLGQGLEALQGGAAQKGNLFSSDALKGVVKYGQDYATNFYNQEWNRQMGLAQIGLQAAGIKSGNVKTIQMQSAENIGQASQAYGQAISDIGLGYGLSQPDSQLSKIALGSTH